MENTVITHLYITYGNIITQKRSKTLPQENKYLLALTIFKQNN